MRISDWSSDVCSSDLNFPQICGYVGKIAGRGQSVEECRQDSTSDRADFLIGACTFARGVIVLHLPLLERTYQTPTIQHGPSASSTQGSIRTDRKSTRLNSSH